MSITRTSDRPTVVLVHGAFAESSSRDGVVDLLLEDGSPVLAVANPLRGVRADSEYLADVLDGLPGDLVLVVHSHGGMRITHAVAVSEAAAVAGLIGEAAEAAAGRSNARADFERMGVGA